MRKLLLGGAASVAVLAAAFTGTAQAQCAWNGFGWNCPPGYGMGYPGYSPGYSAEWNYSGSRDWWTGGLGYYGTAEQYSSSRNGPDPGGGFRHMGRSNVGHTD